MFLHELVFKIVISIIFLVQHHTVSVIFYLIFLFFNWFYFKWEINAILHFVWCFYPVFIMFVCLNISIFTMQVWFLLVLREHDLCVGVSLCVCGEGRVWLCEKKSKLLDIVKYFFLCCLFSLKIRLNSLKPPDKSSVSICFTNDNLPEQKFFS